LVEAVERLADKVGRAAHLRRRRVSVQREKGTAAGCWSEPAAAEFYAERAAHPRGRPGDPVPHQPGFDAASAAHFGCGFARRNGTG